GPTSRRSSSRTRCTRATSRRRSTWSRKLQFWVIQTLNSLALGALLFLLSAGFSLIFGLMRIANLTHGALFMLGAYLGVSILKLVPNLWLAALLGGLAVAAFGGLLERFILRRLAGNILGQVLVTLGFAYIIADLCLVVWGGDPIPIPTPQFLQQPLRVAGFAFPAYRVAVVVLSVLVEWRFACWLGARGWARRSAPGST